MGDISVKKKYAVRSIEPSQTHEWLLKKHYAKRIPSISYAFGLYLDGLLVGVMTIGKPASNALCEGICGKDVSEFVYELNRLCVKDGLDKNTLSYFVSKSLSLIKRTDMVLVSYADRGMNHNGYIYQATNWIYTGSTKERTDIGSEDGTHSRHYDKTLDYKSNRKHRSSKHRYVYFIGKKRDIFRGLLNYKIEPYPKEINKRYDSGHVPTVQVSIF